ncbi:MAG: enoyl-CoA hydratase-related protein [Betaproteobacteria bacterium]|nr:enoyl-CoA hydratase-related protein [Betaproteobacteria bacterium]MDH3437448.1 enoyl-CoA hydratase-related protein [Betaproteobacteria bacterium]
MSYQNILLEQPEAGIYLLTVNRPKALNALNSATLDEIDAAANVIAQDPAARVALVTGAGDKAFVAGADIAEMQNFTQEEGSAFSARGSRAFARLEAVPVPVIALVNGYCLGGGCELALACDWIIATEGAVFGQPEVNLGICAGLGATQRLPRKVGPARALELLTTGRQVKAEEALGIGLASAVVPVAELMQRGLEMARIVASKGPLAVRCSKEAVRRGADMELAAGLALESNLFGRCCASPDQKEGMAAFLEKRPAKFGGGQ